MTAGETPASLSWTMLAAERLYNDVELFTYASTTSLPMPAFDNLTTSATFGGRLAVTTGGGGLLFGAGGGAGGVGATVLWPYVEHKGSANAAMRPNRLK